MTTFCLCHECQVNAMIERIIIRKHEAKIKALIEKIADWGTSK